MAVRPSVRFDVFKRDAFTCSYCGRRPPDVTLELDHIIPVAEGGDDTIDNLTTACWDCNRGKGAKQLAGEPQAIPSVAERTALIKERERQLRAYHAAQEASANRSDAQVARVIDAWFDLWCETSLNRWQMPYESVVRKYVDLIGEAEVIRAIGITIERRHAQLDNDAVRYFCGVLKGIHAEHEGRRKECTVCGRWLHLSRDQDTSLEYHHPDCEPTV